MSRPKEHIFGVTLQRRDRNVPWGVRIVGGADLGTPILVTRVQSGSPSEKCLMSGDIIKKIEDYDARDISHQDAMSLFLKAENFIKLDIKRDPSMHKTKQQENLSQSCKMNPSQNVNLGDQKKVVFPPPNPILLKSSNVFEGQNIFEGDHFASSQNIQNQGDTKQKEKKPVPSTMQVGCRKYTEEESAEAWPYRTTPLVLPGAKTKHEKEIAPTESYLRHHPNPMMRTSSSQYELLPHEVLMKQKVADSVLQKVIGDEAFAGKQVIHRQFNSPIGLYSDQNIVDTIHHQTGVSLSGARGSSSAVRSPAPRKTVVYDPAKSETFKALQEEQYGDQKVQEVTVPAQPRVFTPNIHGKKTQHQAPQTHTYDPLTRSTASSSLQHHLPYVNSMGHSESQIAQSGSFKRLMNMVMGESEY